MSFSTANLYAKDHRTKCDMLTPAQMHSHEPWQVCHLVGKGTLLGVWAKGGAATLELELCQRLRLSEQGPCSFLSCTASSQPASSFMAPQLIFLSWRSLRMGKTVAVHYNHEGHRIGSERRGQRHRASCLVFQMW